MMTLMLITFVTMGLVIVAMAVGVIAGREPLKGSCGGLNRIGLEGNCEVCGGDLSKCEEQDPASKNRPDGPGAPFYDASGRQDD